MKAACEKDEGKDIALWCNGKIYASEIALG
jgi:hypothetical protein